MDIHARVGHRTGGRGIRVTLVSFGGIPSRGAGESGWRALRGDYFPTGFRLEWMQDAGEDDLDSIRNICATSFDECKARPAAPEPVLLWRARCCAAQGRGGAQRRDELEPVGAWRTATGSVGRVVSSKVDRGLAGASLVVAPSRWMLGCIESCYGSQPQCRVIYNGRTPALFQPISK